MQEPVMGIIVIVAYRAKPGQLEKLKNKLKQHHPVLQRENLVTSRQPILMQAKDETIVEVFEWQSQEAIDQAHHNKAVLEYWQELDEICDYVPISELAEAKHIFSEFIPL